MQSVAIIGGGPAGLMAADAVSAAGLNVTVFDAMPSLGRKLLMAGRGGLNLTHSEDIESFLGRYGPARVWLEPFIRAFPPEAARNFAHDLGQPTFVGSSGRVFPTAMKASPLLRAWLGRLQARGVQFAPRRRWIGLGATGALRFLTPGGRIETTSADAIVLALGGASWPRLGSDGHWVEELKSWGVRIVPLAPGNCGVVTGWSAHFRSRFEGRPLKTISVSAGDRQSRGEAILTAQGLEGGAIYALSPDIRAELARQPYATLSIDLRPDVPAASLARRLEKPRGKQSLSSWLRKAGGLSAEAIGLLREAAGTGLPDDAAGLAHFIKAVPVRITSLAGIDRAISTAGGVATSEVDRHLMLRRRPGIFVAGEMLDWDAPTGGYLLQACLALGRAAGEGAVARLKASD